MGTRPPNNKTKTQPGLGAGDDLPRLDSAEMRRVRDSFRTEDRESSPGIIRDSRPTTRDSIPAAEQERAAVERADTIRPRLRDSVRREDPEEEATSGTHRQPEEVAPISAAKPAKTVTSDRPRGKRGASWRPEATTGTRRKRDSRPPVAVEHVGAAAVKLAGTSRRSGAPKQIASREVIAKAPLDTRAAFVLSLVDGRNTVEAIVDMAAMPEEEVRAILARLGRLGLITPI